MSEAVKNYRVKGAQFGPYVRGSIIPHHAILQNADVRKHIENEMLEETLEPVNVELVPPKITDNSAADATTETILENNRLRSDLDRAKAEGADAQAKYEEATRHAEALKSELAVKVTEVDRLRRLAEQEARNREAAEAVGKDLREECGRLRTEAAEWKAAAEKTLPASPGDGAKDSPPVNSTQRMDAAAFK